MSWAHPLSASWLGLHLPDPAVQGTGVRGHAQPMICWISWPDLHPWGTEGRGTKVPLSPSDSCGGGRAAVLGALALVRRPGLAKAEKPGSTKGTESGPLPSELAERWDSPTQDVGITSV